MVLELRLWYYQYLRMDLNYRRSYHFVSPIYTCNCHLLEPRLSSPNLALLLDVPSQQYTSPSVQRLRDAASKPCLQCRM